MDLALYDRRSRRMKHLLAACVCLSFGSWYLADFHPDWLGLQNPHLLPLYLTAGGMLALGVQAMVLIAELREHAAEIRRRGDEGRALARVDKLTGVLNRATFVECVAEEVRKARNGAPVALFLVDLDRFKQMNDTFGHAFGDAVLARVGAVLAREVGAERVGRLGGDEFGFLLTGPISKSTCSAVGERVLAALREPASIMARGVQIEASIGVAWSPEHDLGRMDLMSCADLALYLAKAAGRSRVECFDSGMMQEETYRRSIERELRGAILLNELDMHYQPILDAQTQKVHALEALVRWRHPVRGTISPAEFVPIAERTSLIDQLGSWVFERVCRDAARWPGLRVGINVSPAQLKRRDFIDTVQRILQATGCDPSRVAIELTEGLLMEGSAEMIERLHNLRAIGFRIWLDDFGTGHSGLTYLRDFPIDVIKIDKSFVQDMRSSESNRLFVGTIAQLGRGMEKLVVAEGIETEADLTLAQAAGCSHVQGFHFARPMSADKVAGFAGIAAAEAA